MDMLKVLFVASESVPFIKTGGLADVAGSLPKELKKQGVDVRVVIPKYSRIADSYKEKMEHVLSTDVQLSWRLQFCGVEKLEHDGVTTYFIDNEQYFKRDGLYGYEDDAERFGFFCRAVLDILPQIDFVPDIIHCNDWHTGLLSAILKSEHMQSDIYANIKTIYSIHNLKYQGIFPKEVVSDVLGLDWGLFNGGGIEFDGCVNFMKAGIVFSDYITTVSETYAQEVQYDYYGENLQGLLRERNANLKGIINGIDYDVYNPSTDEKIFAKYDENCLEKKVDNKVGLQEQLGLPVRRDVPMLAIVSRLVTAKGLDLLAHIVDELVQNEDIQLVVLGTGDRNYEDLFRTLAWRYPTKVSANITFDDTLAHRIYAAADIFIMPSQYEPCGIGQLIALKYGAIPVVRETGGLKDTVKHYDKYKNQGNGVSFMNYNAHELLYAIKRALGYVANNHIRQEIVINAMASDYSWTASAQIYKELYETVKSW